MSTELSLSVSGSTVRISDCKIAPVAGQGKLQFQKEYGFHRCNFCIYFLIGIFLSMRFQVAPDLFSAIYNQGNARNYAQEGYAIMYQTISINFPINFSL